MIPPTLVADGLPDRPHKRVRHQYSDHGMYMQAQHAWCESSSQCGITYDNPDLRSAATTQHAPTSAHEKLDPVSENSGSPLVCYGMVTNLCVIGSSASMLLPTSTPEPAFLDDHAHVYRRLDGSVIGALDNHASEVLAKLAADGQIETQLDYTTEESGKFQRKKATSILHMTLYGLESIADDVGNFVAKCGYYLQDPVCCVRNVPYLNPQRLSSLDGCLPMTFDLKKNQSLRIDDFVRAADDILADFETTEVFTPAETPRALRAKLHVHQRQALTFFKQRELGYNGVWTPKTGSSGLKIFVNTVTNQEQATLPPIWKGGILADEMGLGKTLSIIALMASDQDLQTGHGTPSRCYEDKQETTATLVVVPPNVLSVWESQLAVHTHPGELTWFKHHGKNRFNPAKSAKTINVVLTTYQTVEFEYRKAQGSRSSIFSYHWKRVVLDEAHIIRNWKSSTAKSMTSLSATSRWAISGTPIQNSLADFFGLFRFLHFQPYDDYDVFQEDILELWRNKSPGEAVQRFRKLLSCVMIRRQKSTTTVQLPPKHDKIIRIPFDPEEEIAYRRIERGAIDCLDEADNEHGGVPTLWFNAIQQINKLRIACNLGISKSSRRSKSARLDFFDNDLASDMLRNRMSLGVNNCEQCFHVIELSGTGEMGGRSQSAYYSDCLHIFCSSCASLLRFEAPEPCECEGRVGACPLRLIASGQIMPRMGSSQSASPEPTEKVTPRISSKVRVLLTEIEAAPTEKSVVFSFWTSSLDLVQQALEEAGIRFVRIDGKAPHNSRKHLLDQFNKDSTARVILVTTSCGAVGLDLTAASRVHMLEPQWNPSIEEQAMARIHRIGQSQAVTTIRYVMENSLEEHVLNVQDRKKLLSTLLLSRDSSSQELRSLLHTKDT